MKIDLPEGFELAATIEFYRGFTPGSGMAAASTTSTSLTFSFLTEGTWRPAVVRLEQRRRALHVAALGDAAPAIHQVKRMIGLDADATEWILLGRRDATVGLLQDEFPGFFTAALPGPYEAGVGGILGQRTSIAQAAGVRRRLMEGHGESVSLDGETFSTLPPPERLLELRDIPGVSASKVAALHGLARAALAGRLDAERLRAMPAALALAELETLPGIGPWTAGHILTRGAAPHDHLPESEPRVLRGAALATGTGRLTPERFAALADGWRPFRTWVAVLLARHLMRAGQWAPSPDDARGKSWALGAVRG